MWLHYSNFPSFFATWQTISWTGGTRGRRRRRRGVTWRRVASRRRGGRPRGPRTEDAWELYEVVIISNRTLFHRISGERNFQIPEIPGDVFLGCASVMWVIFPMVAPGNDEFAWICWKSKCCLDYMDHIWYIYWKDSKSSHKLFDI